ncbi:MAG: isoprenyl transferase [Coxiellaceae bacterium]|nr:isoprenyl transferase [Coxiellaceae bacterium]
MQSENIPRHVAIIMDGNGRWAKKRRRPRFMGHRAGAKVAKKIIRAVDDLGSEALTLFAFSSENWQRPLEEVKFIMSLFIESLKSNIREMHEEGVRLRVIGDLSRLDQRLKDLIAESEQLTAHNTGLKLNVAISYSGQWDIVNAAQNVARQVQAGEITPDQINPDNFAQGLCLADLPAPDLLIRTSGEMRISNFMLWQFAYSELYFTEALWPDFDIDELKQAYAYFSTCERRYGKTGEQINQLESVNA